MKHSCPHSNTLTLAVPTKPEGDFYCFWQSINLIFICIIRDKEDDNNNASEAETYLEDQTTRYYLRYLTCGYLCLCVCSEPSPAVDETNVGNRDDELRNTYRGLANLRHVLLILNYSYLLTICISQEGLYVILVEPVGDVAMFHRNCVRHPWSKQRVCGTSTYSL
jgi:hypothetical protein